MTLPQLTNAQNILFYARKTEDVRDVMDLLTSCISHIITYDDAKTSSKVANVYVERWVLNLIKEQTNLQQ